MATKGGTGGSTPGDVGSPVKGAAEEEGGQAEAQQQQGTTTQPPPPQPPQQPSSSSSPQQPAQASSSGGMVKLFVGQIPKDMTEESLRPMFSEFGPIYDLAIIRDKQTGHHRGCAFLTYTTKAAADKALEALHNKYKLPNAQNPLQVRRRRTSEGGRESRSEGRGRTSRGGIAAAGILHVLWRHGLTVAGVGCCVAGAPG